MTNNFSTIKNKVRSEKIILVRMNPARQVIDDLTLSGGTTYTMTFDFPISGIKVDGETYTRNDLTALSTKQFSHNEDTGLLTVRLSADISTFTAIIVYYYLFYTNSVNRQATQDPEDASTTLRNWEGRIAGLPEFEVTQNDIVDGILTIGNTSLTIINDDADFQKYLTDNDSFSRKEVKIWQCLRNVENIQKFFFGFASSITVGNQVSISVDNAFSAFNDNLFSNVTSLASKFNATDYPNCHPNFVDKPIRKFYSRSSRVKDALFDNRKDIFFVGVLGGLPYFFTDGNKLVNVNYSLSELTTTNREWAACVAGSAAGEKTETVANVTLKEASLGNFYEVDIVDSSYYNVGDSLVIDFGGGDTYHSRVSGIISSTKIQIFTAGDTLSNGDSITRPAISYLSSSSNDSAVNATYYFVLEYGTDYTYAIDANGVYVITLMNNFEAGFPATLFNASGAITKDQEFIYRAYNHDDLNHGSVVQSIVEQAGLTIDSSSITAANLTSMITNFSIPFEGVDTFPTLTEVLQRILTSTFSILNITNEFKIGYYLINAIAASNEITESEFLLGSLTQQIKYNDIVSTLIFENNHGDKTFGYIDGWNNPSSNYFVNDTLSSSLSNDIATYLDEIKKQKTINFVIKDMTNSKQRIMDVISRRRLEISLVTKGINFSSVLGDEFIIVSSKILGILGQKNIKIFSINKSADKTNIRGLDLLGL